jgi:hypothetical protein
MNNGIVPRKNTLENLIMAISEVETAFLTKTFGRQVNINFDSTIYEVEVKHGRD